MIEQILTDIQLGVGLSEDNRQALVALANVVNVKAGETIFHEGEKHRLLYWLASGRVNLEMSTGRTIKKLLLTLGPGDMLAWSAMLSGGRMTASATTTEPSCLLAFDAKELTQLCNRNHEIGYNVMEHIARRLAERLVATRLQLLDLFRDPSESK
ncbi:MAG: cyclic nucleotide-binding domain-containing protein [Pirellulaceae bacterium]